MVSETSVILVRPATLIGTSCVLWRRMIPVNTYKSKCTIWIVLLIMAEPLVNPEDADFFYDDGDTSNPPSPSLLVIDHRYTKLRDSLNLENTEVLSIVSTLKQECELPLKVYMPERSRNLHRQWEEFSNGPMEDINIKLDYFYPMKCCCNPNHIIPRMYGSRFLSVIPHDFFDSDNDEKHTHLRCPVYIPEYANKYIFQEKYENSYVSKLHHPWIYQTYDIFYFFDQFKTESDFPDYENYIASDNNLTEYAFERLYSVTIPCELIVINLNTLDDLNKNISYFDAAHLSSCRVPMFANINHKCNYVPYLLNKNDPNFIIFTVSYATIDILCNRMKLLHMFFNKALKLDLFVDGVFVNWDKIQSSHIRWCRCKNELPAEIDETAEDYDRLLKEYTVCFGYNPER